jgi:hypothetical protein
MYTQLPSIAGDHFFYSRHEDAQCCGDKGPTKLQWLQDPSEINWDNLNNVRCEASGYFRNNKSEYLKDKMNEYIVF